MADEKKKYLQKPHLIITARMNLSPREQDLLSLLMISIKKKYDAIKFGLADGETVETTLIPTRYVLTKAEVAEIFGVGVKTVSRKTELENGDTGYLLEKACKGLYEKGIEIKTKNGFILTRLLSLAEYDGNNLSLETTTRIVSEMLDYNCRGMGIIDYKMMFKLKGQYDKRLLDIISRFKNERNFECTIDELCSMLGTEFNKYESWRIFSNTVLIRPIINIIKVSDGVWDVKDGKGFKIIKKGSKKAYSGSDIISFRMRYINDISGVLKFKKDYMDVLDGTLNDPIRLNNVLNDISKYEIKGFETSVEFVKMWSACMSAVK